MAVDPTVIAALRAAADADPTNRHLRLHLASTLLEAEDPASALVECQTLLAAAPDDLEVLALAHRAATAAGVGS